MGALQQPAGQGHTLRRLTSMLQRVKRNMSLAGKYQQKNSIPT